MSADRDIPTPAELRTIAKGLYERGWPPASHHRPTLADRVMVLARAANSCGALGCIRPGHELPRHSAGCCALRDLHALVAPTPPAMAAPAPAPAPAPRPVREHELEWARQVLAGWVERHRDAPMVRCGWTGSILR
jgi:hypothetical protein